LLRPEVGAFFKTSVATSFNGRSIHGCRRAQLFLERSAEFRGCQFRDLLPNETLSLSLDSLANSFLSCRGRFISAFSRRLSGLPGLLHATGQSGAKALYNIHDRNFDTVIAQTGGFVATAMFFLFALASVAPACISSFIAGNSFATMIPGLPRLTTTMIGAAIAALLAITGAAANLINLFTIIGASFGSICGAMMADYLLSGRKWAGPREGINFAGYGAWAVGFIVGILPFLPISPDLKPYLQPAAVYSFVAGFLVYAALAKPGLQPKVVSERVATAQAA
jgi:cytosine permease